MLRNIISPKTARSSIRFNLTTCVKYAILTLALAALLPLAAPAEDFAGRVSSVIDGDTIDVLRKGKPERLRLDGIDAPEIDQPGGIESKRFAAALALGRLVIVYPAGQDRYGRTIARVKLPGAVNFSAALVRNGWAWHFTKYSKDPVLAAFEQEARAARRGLWSAQNPEAPWTWRARQEAVRAVLRARMLITPTPTPNPEGNSHEYNSGLPIPERPDARPLKPRRSAVNQIYSGGTSTGSGVCPVTHAAHVPGKIDANNKLHCACCGRYMSYGGETSSNSGGSTYCRKSNTGHVPGKTDDNGRLHCARCGQFM
jgi:endonuclease YncB( thermonuclease family)